MSYYAGLFPIENPKDTRFSINYFTSIGLGSLTDRMRAHLQAQPKREKEETSDESESSSDESSSDEDDEEDEDVGESEKKKVKR